MNVGHILTTHSIQDVQIVVWFLLWAAAPAAEEKRHLETCLRPLSLWAPFYSNSATAVDNWMCFGFCFFLKNINIYIYYFDMFLLDKSLRPFESFEKNEIYVTFFFPLRGLSTCDELKLSLFWKENKKQLLKHEGGLNHDQHFLESASCEVDHWCWFNVYWMLITLIFFFWQWFVKMLTFVSYKWASLLLMH